MSGRKRGLSRRDRNRTIKGGHRLNEEDGAGKSQKKSEMMTALYGESYSEEVFHRIERLDPEFNRIIQAIPYDFFWSRPGLSLRDKSLATVVALIAMGKEEQTKIHMRGFLGSGGTVDELRNVLIHLAIYCGFPAAMNGFAALRDVLAQPQAAESKCG